MEDGLKSCEDLSSSSHKLTKYMYTDRCVTPWSSMWTTFFCKNSFCEYCSIPSSDMWGEFFFLITGPRRHLARAAINFFFGSEVHPLAGKKLRLFVLRYTTWPPFFTLSSSGTPDAPPPLSVHSHSLVHIMYPLSVHSHPQIHHMLPPPPFCAFSIS
jgi:hypothetical protein